MRTLLAPFAALALLAASPLALIAASPLAAPSPSPQPPVNGASPPPHSTITITCPHTPLWTFATGGDSPTRASEPEVALGQRFGLLRTRTTLDSVTYDETNIAAVEPALAGTNYWVLQSCASVS